mgnify:CR=1 FL=1
MDEQNKTPVDDGRKNALLRYIAILFAVAFLFVLLSLVMQMRDSRATISELNAASASALKNAETLQDDNRQLQEENAALKEEVESLQDQLEDAESSSDGAWEQKVAEAKQEGQSIREAYENLLTLMREGTAGQEGNVAISKALESLELLQDYLGTQGQKEYQSLIEGEE